ncbi:hypothetical protein DP137_26830 [Salmonella enterica subsp. enterica serovar Typhimurium]|nr:hypothetical protein DP137_26830 [Salmonella enterica subsp. enterica serovar Typhimurium]
MISDAVTRDVTRAPTTSAQSAISQLLRKKIYDTSFYQRGVGTEIRMASGQQLSTQFMLLCFSADLQ